jgi:hypothetical protein
MISEKQLEANRRNAQQSTGPKTIEGKSRSSRNNLRHGLTGQVTVMPNEDREVHDTFCNELIEGFQPETPIEQQLAQSIAEDSWRLNRARAIENNMFALGHAGQHRETHIALADAKTFQDQAAQFNLLTIYEQRINRTLQRNLKLLHELQAQRKAQREHDMEEAQLLAQLSLANGQAYDPNKDGFVFSNAEINLWIDRNNRLNAARKATLSAREDPQDTCIHESPLHRNAAAAPTLHM